MFRRILRVFILDADVFEEVGQDVGANMQAVIIVTVIAFLTAAASAAIASLPALILQRANPGLYDLFQNALLQAEDELASVNMIIGNVVDPLITGQRVGLSTVTVFLSLVFWGWMFGAVGMLLSVPLSMVVKSIAESNAQTRWLSILMAPAPARVAEPADRESDDEGG